MTPEGLAGRLRRDLGTLESYAALMGILIGAGIFRVTSEAWALTGPSVLLAHLVLAPAVLATSVGYAVFLSTPLGREPGGEYSHISRTLGGRRLAFVAAWLKVISYLGALAYLANALADYVIEMGGERMIPEVHRLPLAIASLVLFYLVHAAGVRWFGRIQVAMCALLGLSLIVLILPGLFAIRLANYRPFFTGGVSGFASSLPPLFFAYAGFESLAQAAGEVKDSTKRLPVVFLKGLAATTVIFLLMSIVAFGVLPGDRLAVSHAPMAEVAARYLPGGAAWFVNLGAIMAIATSLNSTMLVPSRLGVMLAEDGLAPRWLGGILGVTGTPVLGLTITLGVAVLLLVSGQLSLALNVAVFALVILYFLHSLVLLLLPRRNPALNRSVTARIPTWVRSGAGVVSMTVMGALIVLQVREDLGILRTQSLAERIAGQSLTSLELVLMWGLVGIVVYAIGRRAERASLRPEG
ncbi:MAG TPA: APC family permease [Candidatus Polarisedimenticolia bacterium]|nr:APC family permease [Candidatus Polarisedimenticolia bacterium]